MKETGIVRRIDRLGRVVLPAEMRSVMGMREGTPVELYVDGNGIVLKKYRPLIRVKDCLADTRALVEEHSRDMDPAVAIEVADLLIKAEKLLCQDDKV